MNSSLKSNVGLILSGILTVALAGLFGWVSYVASARAPMVATHNALAAQEILHANEATPIVPAVQLVPGSGLQSVKSENYEPIASWYKNKHWWKRNAPVVGGAGGGALIGGLAGGGTGALIGGAVGGGGGYLYKRLKHRSDRKHDVQNYHHDYGPTKGGAARTGSTPNGAPTPSPARR